MAAKSKDPYKYLRGISIHKARFASADAWRWKKDYCTAQFMKGSDQVWGELNGFTFLKDMMTAMTEEEFQAWKERLYPKST